MGDSVSEGTPVYGVSAVLLRTVPVGDGESPKGALGSPSWCEVGVGGPTSFGPSQGSLG